MISFILNVGFFFIKLWHSQNICFYTYHHITIEHTRLPDLWDNFSNKNFLLGLFTFPVFEIIFLTKIFFLAFLDFHFWKLLLIHLLENQINLHSCYILLDPKVFHGALWKVEFTNYCFYKFLIFFNFILFKVIESWYKQSGIVPQFSTGQYLMTKSLRKDKYWHNQLRKAFSTRRAESIEKSIEKKKYIETINWEKLFDRPLNTSNTIYCDSLTLSVKTRPSYQTLLKALEG